MVLLDTDHMSLVQRGGAEGQRVRLRLRALPQDDVATTIVSYEEQMRGWLARLARWMEIITDESRNRIRERLEGGLGQIRAALAKILGRQSRWSGFVDLSDDPNIRGAKPFRCDIVINATLADQAERWRTLIHEMLHTFSEGYHPLDYMAFRGWEEGVVEQSQRVLRPVVLAELEIKVDEEVFTAVEADHEYAEYVRVLEGMREALGEGATDFYSRLLATPIRDRRQSVFEQGMALPVAGRRAFLSAYSSGDAILKTGARR